MTNVTPAGAGVSGPAIYVGGTTVANGTDTYLLYDNAGVLGNVAVSSIVAPLVVASTAITGGTTTRILYDNAGVLGEYTISGTGTVVAMTNGPTFTAPVLGAATATSVTVSGLTSLTSVVETFTAPAITANVLTLNLNLGTVFNVSNNANITTLTISNATSAKAQSFDLILTANGSGFTQAWAASIVWPGGLAPTLTTTNGKRDWLHFKTNDGGTTWFGVIVGQNY